MTSTLCDTLTVVGASNVYSSASTTHPNAKGAVNCWWLDRARGLSCANHLMLDVDDSLYYQCADHPDYPTRCWKDSTVSAACKFAHTQVDQIQRSSRADRLMMRRGVVDRRDAMPLDVCAAVRGRVELSLTNGQKHCFDVTSRKVCSTHYFTIMSSGQTRLCHWIGGRCHGGAALSCADPQQKVRRWGGIEYELGFWDRWMRSRGGKWPDDFRQRLNPRTPFRFQQLLAQASDAGQRHFTALDVGAGPLPKSGHALTKGRKLFGATNCTLEVIAVDPLAKDYDRLLRRHGMVPPTRTRYAHGERLLEHFVENFFDLVYALNSIDHAREPLKVRYRPDWSGTPKLPRTRPNNPVRFCTWQVLQQMLAVARCGHYVVLGVTANEGVHMGYDGYHKWNFANLEGRLTLHAANMSDVDVHTALGTALVQSIRCNPESVKLGRSKPGVLLCHIRKGHEACDEHDRILDQILQTDKARRPVFHRGTGWAPVSNG
tara:strand:+ start:4265 stop:5728 length:1464 start_codon:yes stop_codon:yes gene_type:complete